MEEERGARQKTKAGRAKMKDQTTSVCESECRGCIGIRAGNWNDGGPVMMEWNCETGMAKSSWNDGKMWSGEEGEEEEDMTERKGRKTEYILFRLLKEEWGMNAGK